MSDGGADEHREPSSSRERILDAALTVFGEKGFNGATTKEIALRADANEVTLFRIFNNKISLFEAVIKERMPRSQLMKELHFDRGLEIRKVLIDNSVRLLQILHTNRNLVKMLMLDLPRLEGGPRSDPISSAFIGPLSGYLASHSEIGKVRSIDPETAAEILYGTIRSFYIDHYLSQGVAPEPASVHQFVNKAVDLYLEGILKKPTEQQPVPGQKRRK